MKASADDNVISFAGGLPNPHYFPLEEVREASNKVLAGNDRNALQYSTTEGFLPLREFIAARLTKNRGFHVDPDDILITNGSQQGLDLLGKTFLNPGDGVVMERPGYLGAIQAFSMFEPRFYSVPLLEEGPEIASVQEIIKKYAPKLFYVVPNFQNPSGITHNMDNRRQLANVLKEASTILVEDDPYGELRFIGHDLPAIKSILPQKTIYLGSFSKIVAPAMRLGWICAPPQIMDKLIIAKQAADLHSNFFAQQVVNQFLNDNNLDEHIARIRAAYGQQRNYMVKMIEKYFPPEISITRPEGGMFLWAALPDGMSSLELFNLAAKNNVVFVPGNPFYVDGGGNSTLRLNYTNCDEATIEEGVIRLAQAIKTLMAK
ncbi:MAG: PLP-dependent aminotransferase family protein [Methylocystaceae bacterium]